MHRQTKHSFHQLFILISLLFLNSCQNTSAVIGKKLPYQILNTTVATNFAPDGKLWRLIPTKNAVYIDFSLDQGKSFSFPTRINQQDQTISAWPENPPAIEISRSGRINILYYADKAQKSTSFFSYSDDNGQTFSTPTLTSDHAQSNMHYMDKMLVDYEDKLYLFWHDNRDELHKGSGVLSLYYSIKNSKIQNQVNNRFLSADICSCCRTATALSNKGLPIIFARKIFNDGARDHALIMLQSDGSWKQQRVTHDDWTIESCPEQGPAMSIDKKNRIHLTWFTLGNTRQGIYYSQTDDRGKTVSTPIKLGSKNSLASHPDVLAVNQRVIVTWKEFDGEQTTLYIKDSNDRGNSWIEKKLELSSSSKNGHPKLINFNDDIFLSWVSKDHGHQFIKI